MRNFVFLVFFYLFCERFKWRNHSRSPKKRNFRRHRLQIRNLHEALQAYNGIKNPNLLFVGKKLKIPNNSEEIIYEVRKGDSLGGIAKRFGANPSSLALINKIERPDLIRIGQKANHPPYENGSPHLRHH